MVSATIANTGAPHASLTLFVRALHLPATRVQALADDAHADQRIWAIAVILFFGFRQVQEAAGCYEQTLGIAREIGDRQAEAIGSRNLGRLLGKQGDLARASTRMQMTSNTTTITPDSSPPQSNSPAHRPIPQHAAPPATQASRSPPRSV